ncbi:MAG: aspartate/glutamate racemase family protein, partial [Burkholderiales bacterium]|nr:aspartate/glutamate racemase family protein [Burkholderiales bacterium]
MPRILVLNSNTTPSVTDLVVRHMRDVLPPEVELLPATARFGAPYISTEAAYAIAGHSALDALAEAGDGFDAVLLACFGDPGLFALKEVSAAPVVGLAEAAMQEAAAHGRFSIVTGGVLWKVMLERLALALGMDEHIASIRPITLTGAEIAADPDAAISFLADEARAAQREDGAQAVILGGAALAGLAARIAPLVEVPLIDSVHAGARVAARLA